ncbi:MAG TPA: AI-2E family transporter [Azospirillaceae bacterium]|nr:AI-2E family transporter [Azospirillaceae bacterium]
MNPARQLRFWLIGFLVFAALIWLLHGMLLPFVAGMAIAYLLDPAVDRLERGGAPRWLATTLVLLSFLLVAALGLVLLVPLIQDQVVDLVQRLPGFIAWVKAELIPQLNRLLRRLSPDDMERLRTAAGEYAGTLVSWGVDLAKGLFSGAVSLVDILSVIFITPIVAFYLLRDWDKLVAAVDGWLPRAHAETIREQVREADRTLAGFVRGQAAVCLVLGLFYAVALTIVGLDFGLMVGLLAGFLSFIPFVGSLVGFVASVGIAFFQYDELWRVGLVAGIFVFGQAVEGNVLTPKLVGDRVGLHPVWVMFALLAAGSLFGFTGVLLAVPVAAVIGVLVRFGLGQYMASSYYTGVNRPHVPAGDFPPDASAVGPAIHPAAEATPARTMADAPPPVL